MLGSILGQLFRAALLLSTEPHLAQPVPFLQLRIFGNWEGLVSWRRMSAWWWLSKVPLWEGKGESHLTDPLGHSCKKEEQSPAGRELSGAVCWCLKASGSLSWWQGAPCPGGTFSGLWLHEGALICNNLFSPKRKYCVLMWKYNCKTSENVYTYNHNVLEKGNFHFRFKATFSALLQKKSYNDLYSMRIWSLILYTK